MTSYEEHIIKIINSANKPVAIDIIDANDMFRTGSPYESLCVRVDRNIKKFCEEHKFKYSLDLSNNRYLFIKS